MPYTKQTVVDVYDIAVAETGPGGALEGCVFDLKERRGQSGAVETDNGWREDYYLHISKLHEDTDIIDASLRTALNADTAADRLPQKSNVHIHFHRESDPKLGKGPSASRSFKNSKFRITFTGRCPTCDFIVSRSPPALRRHGYAQPKAHRYCHGPVGGYPDRDLPGDLAGIHNVLRTLKNLYEHCDYYCKYNEYAVSEDPAFHHNSDTTEGFVARATTLRKMQDTHDALAAAHDAEDDTLEPAAEPQPGPLADISYATGPTPAEIKEYTKSIPVREAAARQSTSLCQRAFN